MKKFLLIAIIFISNISIAQTITVTNNTTCAVEFVVYARDVNNPGCTYFVSSLMAVPAGSGPTPYGIGSFSWSPSIPGAGFAANAFNVNYDNITGCKTAIGLDIGNPGCGYSSSIVLPFCSCLSAPASATWTQTGPSSWTLVFN